tara:strand:- start:16651 stop:17718 length:1068 start_codon:yes stop_codon:yes gene_type:complete
MKIAIIGLGAATKNIHVPALKKLINIEVVGGYDANKNISSFSFPIFSSAEELLNKTNPDLVIIATPTFTHFELTCLALSHNCHVLVEKPFMESLEQADHIIALSNKVQRWVIVNNQYRFMNIHQVAKKQINTDKFGDLLFICASQTFFVSDETETGWRGQDKQRTCKEFGIHVLDLCRFFFDEDPVAIYARMPKGSNPDGPDLLNLIQLEFSGDRVAQIILDRLSKGTHRYLELRLDGSKGVVETSIGGKLGLNAGINARNKRPYLNLNLAMGGSAVLHQGERSKQLATDPLDLFVNATYKLLLAFISALKNGETPPCNAIDNRNTLALMFAAYESSEKGSVIDMSQYYEVNLTL